MNTILDLIPCVMGLPTINENLNSLIDAMSSFQGSSSLGIIQVWAKIIGLTIALGVGANECFQMMLGRRGLDVMKLLHIVIISFCISFAGSIADMAKLPGKQLEITAKAMADGMNDAVKDKEEEVASLQQQYIQKVREQLRKLEENKEAEDAAKDESWYDKIVNSIDNIKLSIENRMKEMALLTETKICEWISLLIRYGGEILFQVSYYGLLISQNIFLHILAAFAPLMFAISLAPHFKSAWSQWLSKLISVSLWGFVTYICLYYVDFIMLFNLQQDITSYESLMQNLSADVDGDAQIGAIGMQALGSTCMYVVGLLVGVRVLAFVPEVASWLIPGGVSSGAGGSSAAMGAAAGGAVGSIAQKGAGQVPSIASAADRTLRSIESSTYDVGANTANYIKDINRKSTGMLY